MKYKFILQFRIALDDDDLKFQVKLPLTKAAVAPGSLIFIQTGLCKRSI